MFSAEDAKALESLMNESPKNRELIEKMLSSHQVAISKISHEIRNPLTVVYSTVQLIQTQHPEVKAYKYWTELVADIRFMVSLLEELSAYNNGERLKLVAFDFKAFMEHLVLSFAASVVDKEIIFTSKVSSELPNITGDQTKLREVFFNIFRNACEAVEEHGNIRLDANLKGNCVVITVEDDGCGIEESHIDNIFLPFATYKEDGTGLGLAVVKRVIDAHHGTVNVSSTCEKGTIFTVSLPITQPAQSG